MVKMGKILIKPIDSIIRFKIYLATTKNLPPSLKEGDSRI